MKRVTLEFNDEVGKILERLKKETGKSMAEILRQAIILRDYFEEKKKEGKDISVTSEDGQIEKIIFM